MKIRKYNKEDRYSVEQICISTMIDGELDKHFEEKDLFVKIWLSSYLDYQAEDLIIVEDSGRVVGYLIPFFGNYKIFAIKWLIIVLFKFLAKKYKNNKLIKWFLFNYWKEIPKISKNSAHFHLNLKEGYRSQKIGHKLINMFENKCKDRNIKKWYAILFVNQNRTSLKFHERLGLVIYDKKECTLFNHFSTIFLTKEIL
jgi:GNAT superfamily N-acetyltransferase